MTNNNKDIPHHVKKKEKPCFRNSTWQEGGVGENREKKHQRNNNERKMGMMGKGKMVKIKGFNETMNENGWKMNRRECKGNYTSMNNRVRCFH